MKTPVALLLFCLLGLVSTGAGASLDSKEGAVGIDRILEKSWKAEGLQPNAPASDEVFLRRVYLDAVGRIPTIEEATAFLESTDKDKRSLLISSLLESEGYANHFYHFWADILRVNRNLGGGQNITPFYIEWIRDSLRENKPYDQFVRELLTAEGQAWENGAIGFTYRDQGMPLDHMAATVRVFLGTRLECAQCHNHPFDKWTQMDFFHMAAFSFGMGAGGGYSNANYAEVNRAINQMDLDRDRKRDFQQALREVARLIRNNNAVAYSDRKLPQLPHDYQYDDAKPKQTVEPLAMFGTNPEIASPGARIHAYAEWMTAPENPRFTKVVANRLWKKAMGLGLIEPVDELTDSTRAMNPELMSYLETLMVELDYDMKAFLAAIFQSEVYQREATQEEIGLGASYAFTGPLLRRMTAEQIWDSVVAMVNPDVEAADWKAEQQFHLRMLQQQTMQQAIGTYDTDEMLELTKEIANFQRKLRDELADVQKQLAKARAANDKEQIQSLNQRAGAINGSLRRRVQEVVYDPALERIKVKPVAFELPSGDSMEMDPSKVISSSGQIAGALRKLQEDAEDAMFEKAMDELGITGDKERRDYLTFRRAASRMLRATHVGSPAPDGHFLREFGQSDREAIENANDEASVPQALALLNGSTFPMLSGNNSVLVRTARQAEDIEERTRLLFLGMLTREPSAAEMDLLRAAWEARGEKLYADTVFALLNSPEFLFVQ